jgi:autotransporter-associated beta strand protein
MPFGGGQKVTLGGTTYYYNTTISPSYAQVTNTSPETYAAGNYVVATGLTGGTQTVTVQGANQPDGGFCGFEIVDTAPTSQTWALANAVTLSADSTIDVTGPSNGAVTGLLTIGGNRLSVTGGGGGANTAYSLTLGSSGGVLLTGNPTFDVANNGSGPGTLVLGALNDGGAARTITKSDCGALTLAAAAIAMNANDVVNVTGGTLNSDNSTALGAGTTVNVADAATFTLGASQTLGALGDAGDVVVNGASIQLNGNALTVGGGNNLSSTFSGVIADGTGGAGSLIKAGTGILTLSGSNTYSGGTVVDAGTLILESRGAIANGTSLTVGADASSIFGDAVLPTAATVPEPTTLALFSVAGLVAAAATWRRRSWGCDSRRRFFDGYVDVALVVAQGQAGKQQIADFFLLSRDRKMTAPDGHESSTKPGRKENGRKGQN